MPFEKGHVKMGGKREGSKNKKTQQWEVFAAYCMNGGLQKFQEELSKLSGKDYVIAFTNLLEFHAPKLARAEVKVSGDMDINHNIIKLKNGTEIVL